MYERFVQLLQENNITAYRVSKDTGVTQTTLSDWKLGKCNPKVEKLKKIADYFNVSLDWLSGNSEFRNNTVFDENEPPIPDRIKILARHLQDIPDDDREQIMTTIENTVDIYLNAKGLK